MPWPSYIGRWEFIRLHPIRGSSFRWTSPESSHCICICENLPCKHPLAIFKGVETQIGQSKEPAIMYLHVHEQACMYPLYFNSCRYHFLSPRIRQATQIWIIERYLKVVMDSLKIIFILARIHDGPFFW
jgi:hypothetical protein